MSEAMPLALRIEAMLAAPTYFFQVLEAFAGEHGYRGVLRAWSDVRERCALDRDELGRYWLAEAPTAASKATRVHG